MAFGKIFRRRPAPSHDSEQNFSIYAPAPDMRTTGLHGGGTTDGRLMASSRPARHPRPYGPAPSANPPPAFVLELSGDDATSNSVQPHHHHASNNAYTSSQRYQRFQQRQRQQQQHTTTPYAQRPRSSSTGPSVPRLSQSRLSQTESQSQNSSPTCRDCTHPLTLCTVRNDKGNHGRPFYRCDRCGEFRAWADLLGVYDRNPDCQCGECSRLEESNEGVWYFSCVTGRCDFYTERNWRDDAWMGGE